MIDSDNSSHQTDDKFYKPKSAPVMAWLVYVYLTLPERVKE